MPPAQITANLGACARRCGQFAPPCGASLLFEFVKWNFPEQNKHSRCSHASETVAFVIKIQVSRAMLRFRRSVSEPQKDYPEDRSLVSVRTHTTQGSTTVIHLSFCSLTGPFLRALARTSRRAQSQPRNPGLPGLPLTPNPPFNQQEHQPEQEVSKRVTSRVPTTCRVQSSSRAWKHRPLCQSKTSG